MPVYELCHPEVADLAKKIIDRYESHHELRDESVTISFLFAYPKINKKGRATGPAISDGGYAVNAKARIVSLKDRCKRNSDAEILINGDWWGTANEKQRLALLDHELEHFRVRRNRKTGACKRDDLNRPMLRIVKHDVQFGWFDVIAQRHGDASQECIQAKRLMDGSGQLYWAYLFADADESKKGKKKDAERELAVA